MNKIVKGFKPYCLEHGKCQYSTRYDAYFCVDCNEWAETKCGFPTCEYCAHRTNSPLNPECLKVIPNTFIVCGEDGNYCSPECQAWQIP